jgi:hypothetical protein
VAAAFKRAGGARIGWINASGFVLGICAIVFTIA